ncbi:mesaconyl-C(4)-CoA hydratase [Acrocarpospora pleiomorpha]|uniref:Mesaconyl-C(4)-CoA hydratase n=1 Tax=Acrocarpospora pleiomorpha TaxID=90975 RepID=A0A5M3XHJ2_9ACTN|nr:MaoC family dehydratase N-terminal domain-containing protein [Acrocarpospora pleiomorpha]GES20704.1 mesaconyl-C(4)-CoA hydratase [Acrocarpospora pleiomorpha]
MTGVVERTEHLVPEPAYALGALLGVPVPDITGDDGLPLLWHWFYLLDRPAQSELGPDGHPAQSLVPESITAGRRRMWAGGRVRQLGPLRCGADATKVSQVASVRYKQGRTGPLAFVTVDHRILQDDRVVIAEQQDLVYREPTGAEPAPAANGDREPPAAQPPTDGEWAIAVSPSLLFRFSALTYNAHRIHYDRDYARDVEGYPGLVVHGPLQALAMAEYARARGTTRGQVFEYRLLAPLIEDQGLIVRATRTPEGITTQVRDATGRRTASGLLSHIDVEEYA